VNNQQVLLVYDSYDAGHDVKLDRPPPLLPPSTATLAGGGVCNCTTTRRSRSPTPCREMLFLCLSMSLLLSFALKPVEATKICPSMSIKSDMSRLKILQDCTIIEGYLIIAAMPNDPPVDAGNYTFPLLREVTDFVLLYQAKEIVDLDHIFPNLSVIRGNKLVLDFALIIYQMDNMIEIGLKSLTHILKGGVRIEKNRNLCYVNTIYWEHIVHKDYHGNILLRVRAFFFVDIFTTKIE
jgi:hypothetical protein